MDALHRTTSHLLEPLFALIAAWTPKPIIITDNTVFVNVVAHVPVLILAFLLFSPTSTRRVRAALAPVAVAATLRLGFTFRHAGAIWGERNKGLSMTATYWAMKAVELALRSERPAWLGWETDAGDAREKRRTEANRVDTWRRRAYLALTYSYSYRSLGWSTGPSKTRFAVPKVPVLRRRVLVRHLGRAVSVYLLMDALHGLFALHPSFSTLASARSASLYEPLVLPYLPPIPPLASATVVSIGWATALYLAQAFPAALVGFASALLSPDWRTTELHYPTLFRDWWAAESIGDIWGVRWHKLYFATLLFNGYRLPARIGGRLAGVVGTFVVSGLFHSIGYFSAYDPLDRVLAVRMFDFFLLCGLAILLEAAFHRVTGWRVRGPLGRLWTWTVLLYAGNPLAEAWLRCGGAIGLGTGPEGSQQLPFGRPMVRLGRWLWSKLADGGVL